MKSVGAYAPQQCVFIETRKKRSRYIFSSVYLVYITELVASTDLNFQFQAANLNFRNYAFMSWLYKHHKVCLKLLDFDLVRPYFIILILLSQILMGEIQIGSNKAG
jgi:hypothetical protein